MDVEVIRDLLRARPFEPIVFHLDNGEKQIIRHPEIIVTDVLIIAVDDEGLPVFIKPEAITAIRRAPHTKRSRGKRVASRRRR